MNSESLGLAIAKALPSALSRAKKPVAFLVGSPLSMPDRAGAPGVPGVHEILKVARAKVPPAELPEFEKALGIEDPTAQYQRAMRFLRDWHSQDAVNGVVREAVRRARISSESDASLSDEQLEKDLPGWYLPAGTHDLARLVMSEGERWRGPILTTNFDPLLSVAIEKEGGIPVRTILDVDGRLRAAEVPSPQARSIVHLHGFWQRSDTLHTPDQLTAPRPHLTGALRSLLQRHTLLVVAYGGWDDVFTKSLAALAYDEQSELDVLWGFYETEPALIAARYRSLLEKTAEARLRGRFRMYAGVNCNELFAQLLEQSPQGASIQIATPPAAQKQPPSNTSPDPLPTVGEPASEARVVVSAELPQSGTPINPPQREIPASKNVMQQTGAEPPKTEAPSLTNESIGEAPTSVTEPSSSEPQKNRTAAGSSGLAALLLFIGVVGYLNSSSRQAPSTNGAPTASSTKETPASVPSTSNPAVEALRLQHSVRSIQSGAKEAARLPPGTFGFIPVDSIWNKEHAPVNSRRTETALEIHKTPAGELLLIGYVGRMAAEMIARGEPVKTPFTPSPSGQRMSLAAVPLSRIRNASSDTTTGQAMAILEIDAASPHY